MNRLVASAGVVVCAALFFLVGGRSNAQPAGGGVAPASGDAATARMELIKLQEKVTVAKAGSQARFAYLQQGMEQLRRETDEAIAQDKSITANKDAETILEQRVRLLRGNNVGSADDQMRASGLLASVCGQISERQELLRTRYHGGAMGVMSEESVKTEADIREEQAKLDLITARLGELNGK